MGYDMYLVKDDEAKENRAEAHDRFDAAVAERDQHPKGSAEANEAQKAVDKAYGDLNGADVGYFRLNIWSMGEAREFMAELGMLIDLPSYQYPDWPQPEDYGLTEEQVWEDDEDGETADPRVRAFREAGQAVRSWSVPDCPGIPPHKLGSNDGWIVTPLECTSALAMYRTAPEGLKNKIRDQWRNAETGESYWDEWIEFLERAAAGEGFAVW